MEVGGVREKNSKKQRIGGFVKKTPTQEGPATTMSSRWEEDKRRVVRGKNSDCSTPKKGLKRKKKSQRPFRMSGAADASWIHAPGPKRLDEGVVVVRRLSG